MTLIEFLARVNQEILQKYSGQQSITLPIISDLVQITMEQLVKNWPTTPGCDCDQNGNPDLEYHASDCNWRKGREQ
jgi:hypothetical protein